MGKISRKLANRFRKGGRLAHAWDRIAKQESAANAEGVRSARQLIEEESLDPLHAAYSAAQNLTSFFAELVSRFDELDEYCEIVGAAEDEYMPGGPPLSPLTNSYFASWAFFDVRFGSDRETIGSCLVDLAETLGIDPFVTEAVRRLRDSRMGVYEHRGCVGGRTRLRDLVTGEEFGCYVPAGYRGQARELWYARCCPPLDDRFDYHVVFTTPYVLTETSKSDWTAYLKRSILQAKESDGPAALHDFLKYGHNPRSWSEYIFLAYHHHRPDAIFLAGLPDVKGSLPLA